MYICSYLIWIHHILAQVIYIFYSLHWYKQINICNCRKRNRVCFWKGKGNGGGFGVSRYIERYEIMCEQGKSCKICLAFFIYWEGLKDMHTEMVNSCSWWSWKECLVTPWEICESKSDLHGVTTWQYSMLGMQTLELRF